MSRFVKVAVLVVVVVASSFAAGCKSSSGCSSCGAKVILPETAIKQA